MNPAKAADLRAGLKEQKKAKRQAQREEEMRKREEAELIKAQTAAVSERQRQEYMDSRREALELQAAWKHQQKTKSQRPEWDLNDPKMKNGVPARVGDDDPNCGPSSLQKFEGEALDYMANQASMQAQRKQFNVQQAEYRAQKAREEAERERWEAEQLAQATDYANRLAGEQYSAQRQEAYRMMQENKALARQRKQQERGRQRQDDELSKLEAEVTLAQLNEEQRDTMGRNGRVQKHAFKGMTVDQKRAIQEENARILADNEVRRQAELEQQLREDRALADATRAAQNFAGEQYLDAKRREMQLAAENRLLRRQAKQAEAERNKAAKSNAVEATFFDRFNNDR